MKSRHSILKSAVCCLPLFPLKPASDVVDLREKQLRRTRRKRKEREEEDQSALAESRRSTEEESTAVERKAVEPA